VDPPVKTMEEYTGEMEDLYAEIRAAPSRVRSLQKSLTDQYHVYSTLAGEYKRLRAEAVELSTHNATLQSEQDRLGIEKLQAEQERDQALAVVQELREALDASAGEIHERDARLAAIYASTTWRLYRYYAACVRPFMGFRDSLSKLRQWLVE